MNIAVYCSSSNTIGEKFTNEAYKLGEWIAENGHTLVFGGATGGSMTSVSEGAYFKGGKIIGVIPNAVVRMNRESPLCSELISCETMSERKEKMKTIADVFVALPGSFGTLDELFDVVASGIVGEHKKPTILVNQDGFFDDLISLKLKMENEGFIPASHQNYKYIIADNIDQCTEIIKTYYL